MVRYLRLEVSKLFASPKVGYVYASVCCISLWSSRFLRARGRSAMMARRRGRFVLAYALLPSMRQLGVELEPGFLRVGIKRDEESKWKLVAGSHETASL